MKKKKITHAKMCTCDGIISMNIISKYMSSDLQLSKLKENFLATQAFANPENISEPQTGIEPATF